MAGRCGMSSIGIAVIRLGGLDQPADQFPDALYAMLRAPAFQGVDQFFADAGVPEIHRAHPDCDRSNQQKLHDDIQSRRAKRLFFPEASALLGPGRREALEPPPAMGL